MVYENGEPSLQQREQVISDLRAAAEDGRLSPLDLDGRVEAARMARTVPELYALVPQTPMAGRSLAGGVEGFLASFTRPRNPATIMTVFGSQERLGVWQVPPVLEIQQALGDLKLNFCAARLARRETKIVVKSSLAEVTLVVPLGWGVDTMGVTAVMGDIKCEVSQIAQPGMPQLVLQGYLVMGSIKVRHPNRRDAKRLAKALEQTGY